MWTRLDARLPDLVSSNEVGDALSRILGVPRSMVVPFGVDAKETDAAWYGVRHNPHGIRTHVVVRLNQTNGTAARLPSVVELAQALANVLSREVVTSLPRQRPGYLLLAEPSASGAKLYVVEESHDDGSEGEDINRDRDHWRNFSGERNSQPMRMA